MGGFFVVFLPKKASMEQQIRVNRRIEESAKTGAIKWTFTIFSEIGDFVEDVLVWHGNRHDSFFWKVTIHDVRFNTKSDYKGRRWTLNALTNQITAQKVTKRTKQYENVKKAYKRTDNQNNKYFVFNDVILPELERWGVEEIKYACWEITKFYPKAFKIKQNKIIYDYFKRKPTANGVEIVILLAIAYLNLNEWNKKEARINVLSELEKFDKLKKMLETNNYFKGSSVSLLPSDNNSGAESSKPSSII